MAVVKDAAWRDYEAVRVETSNAMMGLLAGAQLAAHLLQLTKGSDRLLPEVYPLVPHIGRFNLTSEAASEILASADAHLGAMSVPYALSVHEDYLRTCLTLLARAGRCTQKVAEKTVLAGQHVEIEKATGGSFDTAATCQLDTLRMMRNCTIHAGGRASETLVAQFATWPATVAAAWVKLAKRDPRRLKVGAPVTFGHGELILTLAVTKTLARAANEQLQPALPRSLWADLLLEDVLRDHPGIKREPNGLRKTIGVARFNYGPLKLTEAEIRAAWARA